MRSRLAALETLYRSTIDPSDWNARFAETPPLETFRPQMSLAMSGDREDDDLVCEFLDSSRTHVLAPIVRSIVVSIGGMVHKLGQTTFGLQDAAAAIGRTSCSVAKTLGCNLGTFTHCVWTSWNLVAKRYGDDSPVLGTRREVREFLLTCRSTSC